MASPIVESWIYATMLLQNEWGQQGTGFLVYRAVDDDKGRIFLVTNKHVLHNDAKTRQSASKLLLYLNVKNPDGSIKAESGELPLTLPNGSKRWREHHDDDVDVLAFEVTDLLVQNPQIEKRWATYDLFADKAKLDELDITMGEDVVVLGYPLGLRHRITNFPLMRSGMIATRIGETLEDEVTLADGSRHKRELRGFLIDGGIVPGSSGSPVILKPTPGRFVKGNIVMGPPQPILLGIVAETRYAPISTSTGAFPSFAGLGLAFDAATIKDTIEKFFA